MSPVSFVDVEVDSSSTSTDCPSEFLNVCQSPCQSPPQVHEELQFIFRDLETDFIIPEHLTASTKPQSEFQLPEFPHCPGFNSYYDISSLPRPQVAPVFSDMYPAQAALYSEVVSHGLPNFKGARVPVMHQLNIPQWRKMQHLLPDQQLVDFLEYGFPVGYTGTEISILGLPNHSSAMYHAPHVHKYLDTEVSKQAMLGPLKCQPFQEWFRVNPAMTRPKRDSDDMRVILDMSFPFGNSVNSQVPRNMLEGSAFKMQLPSPLTLAREIHKRGPNCLFTRWTSVALIAS